MGELTDTIPEYRIHFQDILTTQKIQPTEGSLCNDQINFFLNFLNEKRDIKKVIEVGFNGGLSAATILSARPDISLVSQDLAAHDQVVPAKNWIDSHFPGRHLLIVGDSQNSLPASFDWISSPDCIFMDGGHTAPIPENDLRNLLKIARPDTWIIIDDLRPDFGMDVITAVNNALGNFELACQKIYDKPQRTWGVFKKIAH